MYSAGWTHDPPVELFFTAGSIPELAVRENSSVRLPSFPTLPCEADPICKMSEWSHAKLRRVLRRVQRKLRLACLELLSLPIPFSTYLLATLRHPITLPAYRRGGGACLGRGGVSAVAAVYSYVQEFQ